MSCTWACPVRSILNHSGCPWPPASPLAVPISSPLPRRHRPVSYARPVHAHLRKSGRRGRGGPLPAPRLSGRCTTGSPPCPRRQAAASGVDHLLRRGRRAGAGASPHIQAMRPRTHRARVVRGRRRAALRGGRAEPGHVVRVCGLVAVQVELALAGRAKLPVHPSRVVGRAGAVDRHDDLAAPPPLMQSVRPPRPPRTTYRRARAPRPCAVL